MKSCPYPLKNFNTEKPKGVPMFFRYPLRFVQGVERMRGNPPYPIRQKARLFFRYPSSPSRLSSVGSAAARRPRAAARRPSSPAALGLISQKENRGLLPGSLMPVGIVAFGFEPTLSCPKHDGPRPLGYANNCIVSSIQSKIKPYPAPSGLRWPLK